IDSISSAIPTLSDENVFAVKSISGNSPADCFDPHPVKTIMAAMSLNNIFFIRFFLTKVEETVSFTVSHQFTSA
ncbi:hypothetical protein, partial [Parabacteroides goldsteinii]|uniref:hypothetical protein n=1 Tax=Parabacteroides goldsteinii TaxID=328812 RepID=UPI0025A22F25